ncbi:MAG: cytochrome b5 domain-containing protein [Actinobacteria bacterium]|jgi:cytochrome b involved in lipid metabolism|nr:cytochrome b5 domain-containing protein [Actinomycetota bacterium]
MHTFTFSKRGIAAAAAFPLALSGLLLTASPSQAADVTAAPSKSYSLSQVKAHNKATDCWSVVGKNVYNLTTWIPKHPGGKTVVTAMCGKNGTATFNSQHKGSGSAARALAPYKIGAVR